MIIGRNENDEWDLNSFISESIKKGEDNMPPAWGREEKLLLSYKITGEVDEKSSSTIYKKYTHTGKRSTSTSMNKEGPCHLQPCPWGQHYK